MSFINLMTFDHLSKIHHKYSQDMACSAKFLVSCRIRLVLVHKCGHTILYVGQYTFCSEYYVLQLQSVLMIFKVSTGKIGILHMSYIDRCSIFVYQ